jgi:DNA-binding NarL/FixJ family response regulator
MESGPQRNAAGAEPVLTRVMLVEDHAAFRQALAFMIDREPDMAVVRQAGSLAEARADFGGIDVAVVDLNLPDGNGSDLIPEIRRANADSLALILTAIRDGGDIALAVEAGAAGTMHKSAPIADIIHAIRRLGTGQMLLSPREVLELVRVASLHRAEARETRAIMSRLTPRELDVLHALARGCSDKDMAREMHLSIETVRTHMVNILNKLEAHSRLHALVLAIQYGLVEISRSEASSTRESAPTHQAAG